MAVAIGLDGGGTGTAVIVEDLVTLETLAYQLGPTNRHSVGDDQVSETLRNLFVRLSERGIHKSDIASICFGGAGVDTKEDEKVIIQIFRDLEYVNRLQVVNDSMTALVGANEGRKGAIIISGTGSVALGIGANGEPVRVGGWGHLIDDTGSAYAIARDGIRLALEGFDGRGEPTKIWNGMKAVLKLERHEDLLNFVYSPDRQKQDIAALAPIVTDLAGMDAAADSIIEKTVDDLYDHIEALSERMETTNFQVGFIGSVLEKSDYIRLKLEKKIEKEMPGVKTHFPKKSPAEGALIMAKDQLKSK